MIQGTVRRARDTILHRSHVAHCNRSMPHEQTASNIKDGALIWVMFRGETFRTNRTEVQMDIATSARQFIILPIRARFPTAHVHVHVCVRRQQRPERNQLYLHRLSNLSGMSASLHEHPLGLDSGDVQRYNQVDFWLGCLDDVPSAASFTLILRADLLFVSPLNVTALHSARFLLQWNLWHDCVTHEMADQVQGIGGHVLDRVRRIARNSRPALDACWKESLHNLYNFAEMALGRSSLGYLNFMPNALCLKRADRSTCGLRGNPARNSKGRSHRPAGGWYLYDRHISR